MAEERKSRGYDCPMSRRSVLGAGVSMFAASQLGVFEFASSLFAAPGDKEGQPVVRVGFVRPDQERYFMGWPGADWDNPVHQQHYTRILKQAAGDLDVDLRLQQKPIASEQLATEFLEGVKNEQPDGLIVVAMSLNHAWPHLNRIAKERGDIPTIVFSPVGTSFTGHLQATRGIDGVFVAATEDEEWLATGLRMLDAKWQMAHTRLCVVRGNRTRDQKVQGLGTTLHWYPEQELCALARKTEVSDRVRAIATYYEKNAKDIIEPTRQDIVNAAKNYVAFRQLLQEEDCDGLSINCLPLVSKPVDSEGHMWEPCLAFSKLHDEGIVGGCESDVHAALTSLLSLQVLRKPGFMQDPAPLTVDNTLVGAHCSCPTRLRGIGSEAEPFILRSHQEADRGVSPQVLWPVGERMTILELVPPYETIRVGTGTVVSNIDPDPQGDDPYEEAGGCRTSVEVTVDGVDDTRDVKGFHQLFVLGDVKNEINAYARLAGLKVEHI